MKKLFILGLPPLFLTLFLVGCNSGNMKNSVSSIQSNDSSINKYDNELNNLVHKIAPNAIAYVNNDAKIFKGATSQLIKFDAKNSYDPDGNNQNLSYQWIDLNSYTISNNKSFVHKYDKKGLYEITLKVTDAQNLTAIDRICVLVDIDKNDMPLIVKVTKNQKVNVDEAVSLASRVVCRDDILKYEWREGEKLLSTKANFTSTFKTGKHILVLTVVDFNGNKATKSIVINTI